MNRILISALALSAVASASAITFTPTGSNTSKPTLAGTQYTATQVSNTYKVNLGGSAPISGLKSFSWDFYAKASTNYKLTGATVKFTLLPTPANAKWKYDTEGKYVSSNAEYLGPDSGINALATIPTSSTTLSQTLSLAGYNFNNWHIYVSDLFKAPAGFTITAIDATVTQSPVPEPASFAALAIGGLGLLRRRRKA